MKLLLLCLPLVFGCAAASRSPELVQSRVTTKLLPFRVAVAPIISEGHDAELNLAEGTDVLQSVLQSEVFVSVLDATEFSAAVLWKPDLLLLCELESEPNTPESYRLKAGLYLPGDFNVQPEKGGKLAFSLESTFDGEDWKSSIDELARKLHELAPRLTNPDLAPFELDTASLKFANEGSALNFSADVRFERTSRSRHLRRVAITTPTGAVFEAKIPAPRLLGLVSGFRVDLPPLESGEILSIAILSGSRVHYRRRYAVVVP